MGAPPAEGWSDLQAAFPDLSSQALARLEAYAGLLATVAAPRGLIGVPDAAIPREIGRSLLLLSLLPAGERVTDVGSGAGLPGVPLAAVLGAATLIEPRRRAVAFLELVARELDLELDVLPITAEQGARGPLRETAGVVTARAVAPLPTALELCAPLARVGGRLVITGAPEGTIRLPRGLLTGLGLGGHQMVTLESTLDLRQRVHIMDKLSPSAPEHPRRTGIVRRKGS